MNPILQIAIIIAVVGALGGLINALVTDKGIRLPRSERTDAGTVWLPGTLGSLVVSAGAAVVSWALYGPVAVSYVIGGVQEAGTPTQPGLTLGAIGAAALVGFAGARWWTVEADKKLQRQTIRDLASKGQNRPDVIAQIDKGAPPEKLLSVVRSP
ncbi:MAG: hypothetical protein ACYTGV_19390 [Planctomycetota bacterium]|jgi:hypothetical protein